MVKSYVSWIPIYISLNESIPTKLEVKLLSTKVDIIDC